MYIPPMFWSYIDKYSVPISRALAILLLLVLILVIADKSGVKDKVHAMYTGADVPKEGLITARNNDASMSKALFGY